MTRLLLYNTLTRTKEPFAPMDGKRARIYTCGPTVYAYAHIGNLRTYVFEDLLVRTLQYNHLPLLRVMNITDVGHLTSDADEGEDKMEKGAAREGKTVWDIAAFYTHAFQADLKRLNILPPDIWCKATDHIAEQIHQIQQLERNNLTYTISDGVYFDTAKLRDYGKLARLNIEELKAGARIEVAQDKRNPTDFALWKFSPKGTKRAMEWDSPWGRGFPGWHIECSAMAAKYLGDQFDIHCGGIDHIPVHHTNEIAQAEGALGKKPWVHVWMHGEFLVIDKGKMAKSGENFLTLQTLIDRGIDPLAYRYFCLSAHYRQQLSFSWDALESGKNGYESIKNKVRDLRENHAHGLDATSNVARNHEEAFLVAVNDDLNMPQALAALWGALRDDKLSSEARVTLATKFDAVLGLDLAREESSVPADILALARERDEARAAKDWARSDELRAQIQELGFVVEDTKAGTKVRKA